MSARDHALIEELMALEVLDGLDGPDVQILERERAMHGDCAECRRIESELRDTAGRMAFSLDQERVDPAMADRIIALGREEDEELPPAAPPRDEFAELQRSRGRGVVAALAIAAALILLVGAFAVFFQRQNGSKVLARASGSQQVVHFTSPTGSSGELAMAYTPGQPGVFFWGSDLPDPGEGKAYELWMIDGNQAVSGGCLEPAEGSLAAFVDADLGSATSMAVTTEPAACPANTSTDPVLTATLTV